MNGLPAVNQEMPNPNKIILRFNVQTEDFPINYADLFFCCSATHKFVLIFNNSITEMCSCKMFLVISFCLCF